MLAPHRACAAAPREVGRLVTQKAVQCLIVAPDVERTGGALEDKISQLVAQCEGQNVRCRSRAARKHRSSGAIGSSSTPAFDGEVHM